MASDAPAQVPPAPQEPTNPQPAAASNAEPKTEANGVAKPAAKGAAKDNKAPAADGEKKLSGAEIKARAKAEKQARRAQQKAAQPPPPPSGGAGGQQGSGDKGGKSKQKQDGPQPAGGAKGQQGKQAAVPVAVVKDEKPAIPECYSHLSMAKRIKMTQADKDVHPAVLLLGQQMSAFAISDSTTRLEATLQALKKVCRVRTRPVFLA